MSATPDPFTPADCDLQDFPFMPLQVARLRDSDLAATEDPEACWYAVLLWAAAWHQVPAASLPDDDMVLTRLCGLGRDVRTFRRRKAGALRGFVKCSDGRLYHEVVAEQANSAWAEKLAYRERKERRTIIAANAAAARWASDKQSTEGKEADASAMHDALHHACESDASCIDDAMLKGTGTGTGTGIILDVDDERGQAIDIVALTDDLARLGGIRHVEPGRIAQNTDTVREWLARGATPDDLRRVIGDAIAAASTPIHSLKYFDGAVRLMIAKKENSHGSISNGSVAEQSNDPLLRAAAARRARRRAG